LAASSGRNGDRDYQIRVITRVFAHCGDSKKPEVTELLVQMFDMRRNEVIATAIERMGSLCRVVRRLHADVSVWYLLNRRRHTSASDVSGSRLDRAVKDRALLTAQRHLILEHFKAELGPLKGAVTKPVSHKSQSLIYKS
jgi:hypothetical protein